MNCIVWGSVPNEIYTHMFITIYIQDVPKTCTCAQPYYIHNYYTMLEMHL